MHKSQHTFIFWFSLSHQLPNKKQYFFNSDQFLHHKQLFFFSYLTSSLNFALFPAKTRNHFPQRQNGPRATNHRAGARFRRLGPPRRPGRNKLQWVGPRRIGIRFWSSHQQPSRSAADRSSQEVIELLLRHTCRWWRGYLHLTLSQIQLMAVRIKIFFFISFVQFCTNFDNCLICLTLIR
jgi:hypothetical protein